MATTYQKVIDFASKFAKNLAILLTEIMLNVNILAKPEDWGTCF
jgi:hypothetical protein